MKEIKFTVFGEAKSARDRTALVKDKTGTVVGFRRYMPAHIKKWQDRIRQEALNFIQPTLWEGPVELSLIFYLPAPAHLPKSKFRAHLTKPDFKNLLYIVEDALSGVLFKDDRQVGKGIIEKHYARELIDGKYQPTHPRVEICVQWDEKEEALRPK